MIMAFALSCFLVGLMLSRSNPATIETIDPKSLIRSQEIMQRGDAGGVYIPRKTGNEDPNLHYGIVIDCGSSGSRLYIYVWPEHSGKENELLQIKQLLDQHGTPVVKKLEPGLSSMAKTPENATEYLKSLLDFAANIIPPDKHRDTPLYILATAGLRFLTPNEQKQLLEDLFNDIFRDYHFQIEKTHIQVIAGKLEGIYSWIAINYVLGRFQSNTTESISVTNGHSISISTKRPSTVGILDMGGASAQIAFEVSPDTPVEGEEVAEFSLGYDENQEAFKYKIYVTTFLGYGANKAFEKYIDRIIATALNSSTSDSTHIQINDAHCLPQDYTANYTRNNKKIIIKGVGDFNSCAKHLVTLLNLNATCKRKPCSLDGVYQPTINYDAQDFYGFSEFWYTMEDILKIGGPYARLAFLNASRSFCNSNWTEIRQWYSNKLFPKADLNRVVLQCFKSAWLYAFLHDGLKFPVNYQRLRSASLVNKNDVQWTLGAILYKTRFLPLRSINQVKSTMHYRRSHTDSTAIIILICTMLLLCMLIFYRKILRATIRSLFYRRDGLYSSPSSSNFNQRYQLLTSVVIEDSHMYSSGKTSSSSSSLFNGRLRSV
jgi:Golgi nucleoside diphosphatase